MQLIICDDDNLFIQKLQSYLQLFFRQHHLTLPEIITFTSGEELLSYTGRIDILFLDIEMPGMNGIYVGNILKRRNENIIIFVVTSYSEYLDEAMRFHVFRYLSKPLEKTGNDFGVELPEEIDSDLSDMTITKSMLEEADTLKDMNLPKGTLVMIVKRGDEFLIPNGTLKLHEGDKLLLISEKSKEEETDSD